MLEGEVSLPVLLPPHAILLGIAHDGVDIPMTVKARVEVQHEGVAVLPNIHSKPGETEPGASAGKLNTAGALASPSAPSIHSPPHSPFGI